MTRQTRDDGSFWVSTNERKDEAVKGALREATALSFLNGHVYNASLWLTAASPDDAAAAARASDFAAHVQHWPQLVGTRPLHVASGFSLIEDLTPTTVRLLDILGPRETPSAEARRVLGLLATALASLHAGSRTRATLTPYVTIATGLGDAWLAAARARIRTDAIRESEDDPVPRIHAARVADVVAGAAPDTATVDKARAKDAGHYLQEVGASLGLAAASDSRLRAELDSIVATVGQPGPYLALAHGDVCTDNVLVAPTSAVLVDFSKAGPRHALLDVVQWYLAMPTCWAAYGLPLEVAEELDARYRAALAAYAGQDLPLALADRRRYRRHLLRVSAYLVTLMVQEHLYDAFAEVACGPLPCRSRIIGRIDAFIALRQRLIALTEEEEASTGDGAAAADAAFWGSAAAVPPVLSGPKGDRAPARVDILGAFTDLLVDLRASLVAEWAPTADAAAALAYIPHFGALDATAATTTS
mmetsp:Transcript_1701/g.5495  ORF Transcript_1701/g.5495 Transcript_1701/m.5495 type:complete len:474 (-) Transcript_1701:4-1425(-)